MTAPTPDPRFGSLPLGISSAYTPSLERDMPLLNGVADMPADARARRPALLQAHDRAGRAPACERVPPGIRYCRHVVSPAPNERA